MQVCILLSSSFFRHLEYTFVTVLNYMKFHSSVRRRHPDALFLNIDNGSKLCSSILENVGLRVPTEISELLICFVLAVNVATVLFDALRQLMPSVAMLLYSVEGRSSLTIYYM